MGGEGQRLTVQYLDDAHQLILGDLRRGVIRREAFLLNHFAPVG